MFYYIPAWYSSEKIWGDNNHVWYSRPFEIGFDDTINHMRMFQEANESCSLLVLNYMPNLRYYTHRFDLLEVEQWSLFDQLQGVDNPIVKQLDYRDLSWPVGVEFIYTPFLVIARLRSEIIAYIHFGDMGQLIWIDYYKHSIIDKRYFFDDRGFLSSIIQFTEIGEKWYQTYFDHLGTWRFKEYMLHDEHHVVINPECVGDFARPFYENMTELVRETFDFHIRQTMRDEDILFVASDARHNQLILNTPAKGKKVLSFFEHRNGEISPEVVNLECSKADMVLVDTRHLKHYLEAVMEQKVLHIPLFDTRLQLGKSQRNKEDYLYFLIDGISNEEIKAISSLIFEKMRENENIILSYVSYEMNEDKRTDIEGYIRRLLDEEEETYLNLADPVQVKLFEVEEEEEEEMRVTLDFLSTELDIMRKMSLMRLVIDVSDDPHLYTQIASISSGIPQINKVKTEFMDHKKTGYILSSLSDLSIALDYYLIGLTNWNATLVNVVRKIDDYTSGRLVERIKKRIVGKYDESNQ
ncbi:accessory Sec system protein Asp1 [Streptococcus suis]